MAWRAESLSSHRAGHAAPLRVTSWNIENLAPYLAEDPDRPLRDLLSPLRSPAVLCLQEIRIRPQDTTLIERMRRALPGYRCHCSLNRDERNATYRGGRAYGVATFTRASLDAQAYVPHWDREGRVVMTLLRNLRWLVVNLYAVNGTAKPYWDHERGRYAGDRHAFKRRFIQKLGDELAALREQGLQLILIGDWNVSRRKLDTFPRLRTEEPHALARKEFNEHFMPRLRMIDAFRELHPDSREYTWFNKRARSGRLDAARVDFALISESLLDRVADAGIAERDLLPSKSDHVPLWITLRR
jgi:exodeoxyribonuclease-3